MCICVCERVSDHQFRQRYTFICNISRVREDVSWDWLMYTFVRERAREEGLRGYRSEREAAGSSTGPLNCLLCIVVQGLSGRGKYSEWGTKEGTMSYCLCVGVLYVCV